jgi:crossover junction endodeoxyribonuclease RusA
MIPTYSFTVFGTAAPQGSKRLLGKVMVESSRRVHPWRSDVRTTAIQNKPALWGMAGPMQVELIFWFPRPASHYGTKNGISYLKPTAPVEPISARVGDIDKLSRAVLDALTGVAYLDDRQVIELEARKSYLMGPDAAPYTHISITHHV